MLSCPPGAILCLWRSFLSLLLIPNFSNLLPLLRNEQNLLRLGWQQKSPQEGGSWQGLKLLPTSYTKAHGHFLKSPPSQRDSGLLPHRSYLTRIILETVGIYHLPSEPPKFHGQCPWGFHSALLDVILYSKSSNPQLSGSMDPGAL